MSLSLAQFQDDFMAAVRGQPGAMAALAAQKGFDVYRNTWLKACIDALEANYPAVTCLVGRDWMQSAAAAYAKDTLPGNGSLMHYGEGFPAFLAGIVHANTLAYLPCVARLDWLFGQCQDAADAPALDAAELVTRTSMDITSQPMALHPSTRWHASDTPARTIWQASRAGIAVGAGIEWMPEATLMVRVAGDVQVHAIEPATCVLLDACQAGHTLGDAMELASAAHGPARMDALLVQLIHAGAFAGFTMLPSTEDSPCPMPPLFQHPAG